MKKEVTAVPEAAVRLRVNGLAVATWTASPRDLEELAAGRLLAQGFVRSPDHILALRTLAPKDGILTVDAEVPGERMAAATAEADHRAQHGCGPRFLLDCRPQLIRRDTSGAADRLPELGLFHGLFRALYDGSASRSGSGGHHSAALTDGVHLLFLREEVGRHNAVDKVVGAALLEDADASALGLLTTARISGDIAAKAARAGLAWVASRSVPTTLAVEIAGIAGMPIVARAPGPDATIFGVGEAA